MNKYISPFYRILVPKPIRTFILKKSLRRNIIDLISSLPDNQANDDQKEILEYLRINEVKIFPYSFHDNYSAANIEVFYDKEKGLRYVFQDGKRLYFKRRWGTKRIQRAYSDLSREQDSESPHRYLTDSFTIGSNDILADIGAAEGNFSLDVIDKVKKVYLFEYDREWDEALRATFAPWADKVEIINKYVSDYNDASHVILDDFYQQHNDITFLKIDVDGAESTVLKSCKRIFESSELFKVALCTYHKQADEEEFTALLRRHRFSIEPSRGYMINYYDKKLKSPWLRRGLIRAIR
ncbi:MAG TPA: FkbM family methyltransferase [Bacteroidales bacterium]|nr:FkbM family methyltransferase [Bacteroidales bacterium]